MTFWIVAASVLVACGIAVLIMLKIALGRPLSDVDLQCEAIDRALDRAEGRPLPPEVPVADPAAVPVIPIQRQSGSPSDASTAPRP